MKRQAGNYSSTCHAPISDDSKPVPALGHSGTRCRELVHPSLAGQPDGTEFGEESSEVRIGFRDGVRVDVPPATAIEFPWVQGVVVMPGSANHVPHGDIVMTTVVADGGGDGEEQRLVANNGELGFEAEFLGRFASGCGEWMFPGLHVTTHGKVQARQAVQAQEDPVFVGVDQDYVEDQMLGRGGGFDAAEDVVGGREPGQGAVDVLLLEDIQWCDRFHDVGDERGSELHSA